MKGLKVVELVVAAVSALVMVAREIMKLIGYIGRLRRKKPAIAMA